MGHEITPMLDARTEKVKGSLLEISLATGEVIQIAMFNEQKPTAKGGDNGSMGEAA